MIIVNKQLDELKDERGIVNLDDYKKAFPRLHYTNFDGVTRQIKSIDIDIRDGDVYIQTTISDAGRLAEETKRQLRRIYEQETRKLAEAQAKITAIEAVMDKAELCGEQEDEK